MLKPAREGDRPTELGRLLDEALRCLEGTDLPGANAAIKKVHAEVVSTGDAAPGARQTKKRDGDRG